MVHSQKQPNSLRSLGGVVSLQSEMVPNQKELSIIAQLIHQHSGIVLQPRTFHALCRAVSDRIFRLGLSSTNDYIALIGSPGKQKELTELTSLITVQKTSFFRDRSQFELLEEKVLPDILPRKPHGLTGIHIWSAGCSTGEEPYSIAISLLRRLPFKPATSILATDISLYALAKAMEASCHSSDLTSLTDTERVHFFKDGDLWRLKESVRSMVDFKFHNLVSVPYPTPAHDLWDVIFCRNVLIYFNRETIREIIRRFQDVLAPGGYLFLGSSESLYRLVHGFDLLSSGKAFVYRKSDIPKPQTSVDLAASEMRFHQRSAYRPPALDATASARSSKHRKKKTKQPEADITTTIHNAKDKLKGGDNDAAFGMLFKLTSQYPNALEPYMILGQIAADQGALEEALSWYHVATQVQPLQIEPRFLLAVVKHRIGRGQEAADELRKVLFLSGNFVLGHYYLGVVATHLNDDHTALRSFRNALREADSIDETSKEVMTKLHLTMETLTAASRAQLERLEKKSSRKGSVNR